MAEARFEFAQMDCKDYDVVELGKYNKNANNITVVHKAKLAYLQGILALQKKIKEEFIPQLTDTLEHPIITDDDYYDEDDCEDDEDDYEEDDWWELIDELNKKFPEPTELRKLYYI